MDSINHVKVIATLNRIYELELAGVVRYTHDSLMVYGYNRIPIIGWLREQAEEGLAHAQRAGEMITHLGGQPSLGIGPLPHTREQELSAILRASLKHENEACAAYYELLELVSGRAVLLEEYAREMIVAEEIHADSVNKMLRNPGEPAGARD